MDTEGPIPGWAEAELTLTAADADAYAAEGKVRAGRLLLVRGMEAAEQYVIADEPWSRPLVNRWRRALYAYLRRHRRSGGN